MGLWNRSWERQYHDIYKFKQLNELIEEQNSLKENDNQNSMFDVMVRHEYMPAGASQGTRVCAMQHTTKQCLKT
jgi:hypothetical protein